MHASSFYKTYGRPLFVQRFMVMLYEFNLAKLQSKKLLCDDKRGAIIIITENNVQTS